MACFLWTIWALLLNSFRLSIFRTCFANALEDDYGQPLAISPPLTTFLFATSVYVIIVNSTLFPESFRKPNPVFLCLYEFLVTAFILEFTVACLWTPIDVLVLDTLPTTLYNILYRYGVPNAADIMDKIKLCMTIITSAIATTILFITLHVTKAVDFQELTYNNALHFLSNLETKLQQRIMSEFLQVKDEESKCRCNIRSRKGRNTDRVSNR